MANGSIIIDVLLNSQGAQNALNGLGSGAQQQQGKFGALQVAVTAVAGAITAIGAVAIKAFADADEATTKLRTQLGLTETEASNLTNVARDIYTKGFGESLTDITDALVQVTNNIGDLEGAELENVTKQAVALAQTFDADVNEVTRAAGGIVEAYGISAEQAFDLLANGAQNGLNFSGELFDNIAEYIPLWQEYGFSAEQAFGYLEAGSQDGVYSLDRLNVAVQEFGIRTQDGSKATQDAFNALGGSALSAFNQFKAGEITVAELSSVTASELSKIDDSIALNSIGVSLFGTAFEDLGAEATLGLFTAGEAVTNFAGSANGITEVLEQSIGQRFESIQRTILDAFTPLGGAVITVVDEGLKKITEVFQANSQGITDTLNTVYGYIGPYIQTVLEGVQIVVQTVLQAIQGFWTENGEAIMNIVQTAFLFVQTIFETVFPIIQTIVQVAWDFIVLAFNTALDIIGGVIQLFSALLKGDFEGAWQAVQGIFTTYLNYIKNLVTLFTSSVGTLVSSFTANIRSFFVNVFSDIGTSIANFVEGGITAFSGFFNNVVDFFRQFGVDAIAVVQELPSQFVQIGKDIIQGLINGLKELNPLDYLKDLASNMATTVTDALQIFSPSRVFKQIGVDTIAGLTIGIEDTASDALNALSGLTSGLVSTAVQNTRGLDGGVSGLLSPTSINSLPNQTSGIATAGATTSITNYFTPAESTPYESTRQQEQMLRRLAF